MALSNRAKDLLKIALADNDTGKELADEINAALATAEAVQAAEAAKVRGTVIIGDVNGGSSGDISVTGDLTSANKVNGTPVNTSVISVVFPEVLAPVVHFTLEGKATTAEFDNDLQEPMIRDLTSTGLTIFLSETAAVAQDLVAHLEIIPG